MRKVPSAGLLVFLSALVVYTMSLNGVWSTDHATSFMQLDYSLWTNHTVALGRAGNFDPQSVDDFVYNGNYYSAFAPGAAVLALPFVGLGFMLDGHFTLYGNAMLLSEFFVALTNSIATYILYKLASLYFNKKTSTFIAFAYAFSTISWPFATYFFQSDVSAMLDLLAAYIVIRMARSHAGRIREAIACGAAVGAALTVDYVNAIFVPIIFLFLVYTFKKEKATVLKTSLGFLLTSSMGLLSLALYNLAAFGNMFVSSEQVYSNSSLLRDFSFPLPLGLYLNLFSPFRGLFVYCPILILGALGFYIMVRRSGKVDEGLLLLACFLGILIPYSMWHDAAGGVSFGPRFLVPAIPFLLLPAGFLLEQRSRGSSFFAYALYFAGVLFNGVAAVTSAIPPVEAISNFPFLTHTLPSFLGDQLDTWWWGSTGQLWWIPASFLIIAAGSLPLVANRVFSRRESARVR
ncbi:MAG: glycosyltransferase family 39 protein [Thaumarchaeota archaeon]|nr:glycosyltransferase family 39 protein [Nitrososphaerota archaeon]